MEIVENLKKSYRLYCQANQNYYEIEKTMNRNWQEGFSQKKISASVDPKLIHSRQKNWVPWFDSQ